MQFGTLNPNKCTRAHNIKQYLNSSITNVIRISVRTHHYYWRAM